MVPKIKWSVRALNDLRDIHEFIARDSRRYAQLQIENIQNAVANLSVFPLMGHKVPEFPNLPYREILTGDYRVLYKLDESQERVIIMAIVHVRRLLKEPLN